MKPVFPLLLSICLTSGAMSAAEDVFFAHYLFDTDGQDFIIKDVSGQGNDLHELAIGNRPVLYRQPGMGSNGCSIVLNGGQFACRQFNGLGQIGPFTFWVWIKFASPPSARVRLLNFYSSPARFGFQLVLAPVADAQITALDVDWSLEASGKEGQKNVVVRHRWVPSLNQWFLLAGTFDEQQQATLYINGRPVGQAGVTRQAPSGFHNSQGLYLGGYGAVNYGYDQKPPASRDLAISELGLLRCCWSNQALERKYAEPQKNEMLMKENNEH